jgi:hypothetical protein
MNVYTAAKDANEILIQKNTETTKRLASVETRLKEQSSEHKMRNIEYRKQIQELKDEHSKKMEEQTKKMDEMQNEMMLRFMSMEQRFYMYQGQVNQYPSPERKKRDEKRTPKKMNGGWYHQMMSSPTEVNHDTLQGQDTAMDEVTNITHGNDTYDNDTLDRPMEDTANTTNNNKENEKFVTLSTGANDGP